MPHRREEKPEHLMYRLSAVYGDQNSQARLFTLCLQPPDYTYLRDRYGYTYKFEPASLQKDPVIRLIRKAINDLNEDEKHGLLMCNNNIHVAHSTDAPPIWPPKPVNDNDVKFYTFFQDKKEFPATAPVSIIPRHGSLTVNKVHMRDGGKWVPIKEWLLQLADEDLLRRRGVESSTYFWRKRSKKAFRLMDLPLELRLTIFEHALAPSGEVYPLSKVFMLPNRVYNLSPTQQERENAHVTLGLGYGRDQAHCGLLSALIWYDSRSALEARDKIRAPDLSLIYVSKKVKEEALKAGWEGLKRCFFDHQIFTAVADSRVGVATQFNILGRTELSFTNKAWFNFFGIEVDPLLHRTESECLGHYLAQLGNLTQLDIRFRDPYDGYAGDPWGALEEHTSCQTVMVDWIMTLAFPFIKHIASVNITGYVKKHQKEKWLDILKKQRSQKDYKFDYDTATKNILNTPSHQLPPACICRKSCRTYDENRWTWDYNHRHRRREQFFWEGTLFDFEEDEESEHPSAEQHV